MRVLESKMSKVKDLIGRIFGNLEIIKFFGYSAKGHAIWTCKCNREDCNKEINVRADTLKYRKNKDCGCSARKNYIGQIYNYLEILADGEDYKRGKRTFVCLCHNCGNIKQMGMDGIISGAVISCGCYNRQRMSLPEGESGFNRLLFTYKTGAKFRNLPFELEEQYFRKLSKQNCYYCGIAPFKECKNRKHHGVYIYNGIDRKDNKIGYTIKNSVPCCETCNKGKGKLLYEEFIKYLDQLVNFRKNL